MIITLHLLLLLWTIPLIFTLFNVISWGRGKNGATPDTMRLSILIPARNEAANIEALVHSILRVDASQVELSEIIVYDDLSTDQTSDAVLKLSQRDPRIKLISGQPLPTGWVGKTYACQQLLLAASSPYVLFLDADVRLKPRGLKKLLSFLPSDRPTPLLTAVPQQVTISVVEGLVIPLLHLTYLAWLPLNWANRRGDSRTVAACGQLIFSSKKTLLQLGGFAAVRGEIVDDVALARHAKKTGTEVLFVDGFEVASCRMYQNAQQLWCGFSKNLYLGLKTPLALGIALILYSAAFILPYLVAALSLLPGIDAPWVALPNDLYLLAWAGVGGNIVLRLVLAHRYSHPLFSVVLHPLGVGILIAVALNSFRWVQSGRVVWAGRTYAADSTDPVSNHKMSDIL